MSNIDELNLKVLLENAHIGVVIHRWDTSIVYANPVALELLRLSYEQIIGKDAFDPQWKFIDDAGRTLAIEEYPVNKVVNSLERLSNEVVGVIDSTESGIRWLMVNAYHEGSLDNKNSFVVVTFNDISDSKTLFSFQDIVRNTQDMVIVTEAKDISYPTGPKIVYVNRAFEEITGYKREDVIGETPRILQGSLTDAGAKKRISAALKVNHSVSETLLNYDINGRPYWIEMNIVPLKNKYGEVTHFAAIERDVSETKFQHEQLQNRNRDLKYLKEDLENIVRKRTEELQDAKSKLEKLAYFDPLTNIPNRRFFIEQAKRLVKSCNRRDANIGFGLIDIDDFKKINDKFGHDVGDKVLVSLSSLLKELFREDDAICRYGGEEFAFAVSVNESADLELLAKRLLKEVRMLQIIQSNREIIKITVSVGIKSCEHTENIDFENEVKLADNALYQSKNDGKNRFTIFK